MCSLVTASGRRTALLDGLRRVSLSGIVAALGGQSVRIAKFVFSQDEFRPVLRRQMFLVAIYPIGVELYVFCRYRRALADTINGLTQVANSPNPWLLCFRRTGTFNDENPLDLWPPRIRLPRLLTYSNFAGLRKSSHDVPADHRQTTRSTC